MPKPDGKKESAIDISSDSEDNDLTAPIIVDDSNDTVAKTGKKRNSTDDGSTGLSKRFKGKEPEVTQAAPDFHPARPKPKTRKPAAKVSNISLLTSLTSLHKHLGYSTAVSPSLAAPTRSLD